MTSLNDNLTVLHPPRGLYGCEHPRRRLLTAFERACHGGSEFILVTGHSGVGKTALVQELLKPVIQAQGIFVRGKFQEYRQVQPLLGPVQCMRQLCDWLLGQPEESAEFWRQRLLSGLGPEVGALFEWIPGLELFLGLQASSTPLPAIESQFRLRALLVRWVQLVASEAHPLVLVLDDLHWADPPSLEFIAALRENNALAGVLLIGLYRDDDAELNQSVMDRLMPSRDQMLHLQGLDRPSLQALLADMLGRPDQALDPLAEALHSATAGNPYFTIEQVHALHRDGLLQFDVEHGSWRWNMDEIRHRSMSANVVDFLQTRLDRLPAGVVDMLVALASLEAESTLGLLAKATGKTPEALLRLIVPALREGIVLTPDDAKLQRADPGATLHFCHDRMQQAVMERRNLAWREELHLSMARRLARGAAAAPSADLLRAAEHYAVAFHRIEAGEELRVAHSSFRLAARQARLVGSFALAERFLRLAIQSAPDQATASGRSAHWEIWVELHLACYCQSKYEEADALYERLKQEAPDAAALVESVCIQVMSLSNRTKYGEAVREGCNLLDRLGVIVPASAPGPALKKELQRFYDQLGAGQLERLERAEAVPDALWSAASRVINRMIPGTFFFDPQLACWLAVRVGCGWMDRGYRDSSIYPMACVILATISVRGDYASGYRAATRALSIGDRLERGVETERARHVVALFNNHWFAPLETSIDLAHTAYKGLFGTGELEFACYTYFTSQAATLDLSSSLLELDQETAQAFEFSGRTGNQHGLQSFLAYHQLSRTLQGKTGSPGSFSDETFQEATHLTRIQGNPMARAYFHIYRALSACFFDDDAALIEHAEHAATLRPFITGFYPDALANVLHSLALIARLRVNADADAAKTRHQLDENQRWLARRAADAPMNFGHLHDWIEAERLDLADQAAQSHDLYEQAMRRAKAHHRPWHQAVITHHAGRSLLRREWDQTAHLLLAKASGLYADWGAAGVVREMGLRYPFLAGRHSESMQPFGFANPEEESLWKASQVLASERSLLELVTRLTEMLRQLTGATQVSVLTQDEHGQWVLRGDESTAGYLEGLPLNKAISDGLIPGTVVRLGFKTSQIMLSEDALLDSRFAGDPYWNKFQRCSLLALPVQSRGNLNAFVVLENHLFRGAFTQQHVSRASLLCGQLAISIENALVYRSLELKVTERTSQLEAARRKEAGHAREMEKLLNNQPISVAICSLEANARILFVNEQFVRTFGYRLEEIPTVDAWAIKAYPDATYRQTTMNGWQQAVSRAVIEQGRVESMEYRVHCQDGMVRDVLISAVVLEDQLLVSMVDITEFKETRAILDAMREKLERTAYELTENIPVGTYTMSLAPGSDMARFTFMSRRFLELTGLDRAEAASDPLKAFACVHPDDHDEWLRLNAEAFAAKKAFFGETRILLNGEVRWITAESTPRDLPDGSTLWEGVLIDITAQKQAETELRAAHERLLETERALAAQTERERLLQEMHDGFGSQLATASLRLAHDELSREQVDGLLRECLDDLHLIVDTFNIDNNSLLEALENYHYRLRNRLGKLPIRFGWQLNLENCPSLDERVILQLLRILQEAINNALKHAQASRIDIAAQYGHDGRLLISVADDGIGLPAEAERRAGRGMLNMQGRARMIGAQMEWVDNHPGTRLMLALVLL